MLRKGSGTLCEMLLMVEAFNKGWWYFSSGDDACHGAVGLTVRFLSTLLRHTELEQRALARPPHHPLIHPSVYHNNVQ